jgi:hypothetical protein
VGTARIPFCDFRCPQAEFPKEEGVDGSGSCRTFAAVWCRELGQYAVKNAPCAVMSPKAREAEAEMPVVKRPKTRAFGDGESACGTEPRPGKGRMRRVRKKDWGAPVAIIFLKDKGE